MVVCSRMGVVWLIPVIICGGHFRMGSIKLTNQE